MISFVVSYIDGYHRQLKSKTEKCKKCSFFTHVDYCGVKDCTFEGIELEDGYVDYTLPCEKVLINSHPGDNIYLPVLLSEGVLYWYYWKLPGVCLEWIIKFYLM